MIPKNKIIEWKVRYTLVKGPRNYINNALLLENELCERVLACRESRFSPSFFILFCAYRIRENR